MSHQNDIEMIETPSMDDSHDEPYAFQRELRRIGKDKNKKIIYGLAALSITLALVLLIVIMTSPTSQTAFNQAAEDSQNQLIFDYPTVGIPIPGKTYNGTPVSPKDLDQYDQQVNELLKPYNDTDCNIERVGNAGNDGGYLICTNFLENIQGIINLGINAQDQLGCGLTKIKPVPNHQFDCTNAQLPVCQANNLGNFNYECAAAHSKIKNGKKYLSLVDILDQRKLTKKHIFLKTDTEGAEWDTLKHFPVEDLQYIDQIAFEFHLGAIYPEQWGQLDILRTLMKYFVNINYHMNNYSCTKGRKLPSTAIEATLVNRKLIKLKSQSRSYALHPLNLINNPDPAVTDCQVIQAI